MLDRRHFLAAATAAVAMPRLARAADPLVLWGPPATPGLLLVAAAKDPVLKPFAEAVEVRIWRTPDEMRAVSSFLRESLEAAVVGAGGAGGDLSFGGGHEGDSRGALAILEIAHGRDARASADVFGCAQRQETP